MAANEGTNALQMIELLIGSRHIIVDHSHHQHFKSKNATNYI
jgi:hypothetical protein